MATFFPTLGPWEYGLCQLAGLVGMLIYGSFAEWLLHRYVMHRKFIPRFPFTAHTIVHHGLFRADRSFHATTAEQMEHVTFNWTDHLILIGLHLALLLGFEMLTGAPVLIGGLIGIVSYLLAYEGIHYVFHVPRHRFFEKHRWFRWLKRHHFIHHKQQFKNMNVVLPIADFLLGTRRSAP